jgi:voltage-gated potassium channel
VSDTRRQGWYRVTEGPLMVLALVFLLAYSAPILFPDLPPEWIRLARVVQLAIWPLFAIDYAVRLVQAPDRRAFVRKHPLHLAAVLIPALRPLALLGRASAALVRYRRSRAELRYTVTTYVAGTIVLLTLLAAVVVLDAERGRPGALIESVGDAFWWSMVTVTSVGYGDLYPVTGIGRLMGGLLMIMGIALFGVVTANIAAWFVEQFNVSDPRSRQAHQLEQILAELTALRQDNRIEQLTHEIAALRSTGTGDSR